MICHLRILSYQRRQQTSSSSKQLFWSVSHWAESGSWDKKSSGGHEETLSLEECYWQYLLKMDTQLSSYQPHTWVKGAVQPETRCHSRELEWNLVTFHCKKKLPQTRKKPPQNQKALCTSSPMCFCFIHCRIEAQWPLCRKSQRPKGGEDVALSLCWRSQKGSKLGKVSWVTITYSSIWLLCLSWFWLKSWEASRRQQ